MSDTMPPADVPHDPKKDPLPPGELPPEPYVFTNVDPNKAKPPLGELTGREAMAFQPAIRISNAPASTRIPRRMPHLRAVNDPPMMLVVGK